MQKLDNIDKCIKHINCKYLFKLRNSFNRNSVESLYATHQKNAWIKTGILEQLFLQ